MGWTRTCSKRCARRNRCPSSRRSSEAATATLKLPTAEADRRDPARAWTTIATGQPVERHGVYGLETRRVAGVQGRVPLERTAARVVSAATDLLRLTRPSVASGTERQEKTFWEVAVGSRAPHRRRELVGDVARSVGIAES